MCNYGRSSQIRSISGRDCSEPGSGGCGVCLQRMAALTERRRRRWPERSLVFKVMGEL